MKRTREPRITYVAPIPRRAILLTFLLLILTLAALPSLVRDIRRNTRGIVFGPPPRIEHTDVRPYAVNADLLYLDDVTLERALTLLEDAGFGWIRVRFPWFEIERTRGKYTWAEWDRLVQRAQAHHLRVIALIDGTPPWYRPPGEEDNPVVPPTDLDAFARFAARVAARYAHAIDYYQVWDQPNVTPFWGNERVDPAGYVTMLRTVGQAIRDADPTAFILSAGLAPTTLHTPYHMSDVAFLEAMYQAGAQGTFDILGAKAYDLAGSDPWSRDYTPDRLGVARLVLLREVMERHRDRARPIWVVGWGRHATPPHWQGRPSIWGTVSEEAQAEYVHQVFQRKRQEWPWLGLLTWDQFYPRVPEDDPLWGFALVRPDWTPRPVYWAFQELATGSPLVGIGRYGPRAWIWQQPDAQLRHTIRAEGTSIGVVSTQLVALEASLDGEERSVLLDAQRVHFLGRHLPLQPHVLVLRFDPPGVTTLIVQRDRPWGPYVLLGMLALAAVIALARLGVWLFWPPLTDVIMPGLLAVLAGFLLVAPTLSLSLLTVLLLGLLVLYRVDWGLAAILGALPFVALPKRFGPFQFSLVEIFIGLTWVSWTVWLIRFVFLEPGSGRKTRAWHRAWALLRPSGWPDVLVIGWLLVGAWAASRARYQDVAWREVRWVVVEPVMFYWMMRSRWRSHVMRGLFPLLRGARTWIQRRLRLLAFEQDIHGFAARLVNAFLWGLLLALALALAAVLAHPRAVWAEGVIRLRGVYGSPNNLALMLGRGVALAYALALFLPYPWKGETEVAWPRVVPGLSVRQGYAFVGTVLLLGSVGTFSRGALLIGLPLLFLFLGWLYGRAGWKYAAFLIGGLFLVLLPFLATERFRSLWQGGGTFALRVQLWRASLRMLRDHPLWGVGPDNFLYYFRGPYLPSPAYPEPNLSHPHNVILHFWLAMGIPGVMWLAGMLASFYAWARKVWVRQTTVGSVRALVAAASGMVVYGLAHGLVDQSFLLPDLMVLFFFSVGIVASLAEREEVGMGDEVSDVG